MSNERTISRREFDLRFTFVSFGVTVSVATDEAALLEKAREVVAKAFGNRAKIFEDKVERRGSVFGLAKESGRFYLYKDGIEMASGPSERNLFKYLNSKLRLEVAEFAKGRVFVHAGVVGWKGQAIMLPAGSFAGKSTLTAELVRNGAEYYSDEYAVLNENGSVGPFPRHLSLRFFGATRERDVPVEELGGKKGTEDIPVGMVLFTRFTKGADWQPQTLSTGEGIMELVPNTLTIRQDPAFSLKVLDLVARRAIMLKSPRGDVKKFAKFLLAFFDKHTKFAKMS